MTDFPTGRRLFSTVAVDTQIYVFGGKDENYCSILSYDIFDVVSGKWAVATENVDCQIMQKTDCFHGGVAVCVSYAQPGV